MQQPRDSGGAAAQVGEAGSGQWRGEGAAAPLILWDDKHASRLHIVVPGDGCRGGSGGRGVGYEQMQVLWDACVSDRGTVTVVDGRQLLLTPLRCVCVGEGEGGGGVESTCVQTCVCARVLRWRFLRESHHLVPWIQAALPKTDLPPALCRWRPNARHV